MHYLPLKKNTSPYLNLMKCYDVTTITLKTNMTGELKLMQFNYQLVRQIFMTQF